MVGLRSIPAEQTHSTRLASVWYLLSVLDNWLRDAFIILFTFLLFNLRSPTLGNVLHKEYGYNTRACGSSKPWALIPITEALIVWADQIVFVNKDNYLELDQEERDCIKKTGADVVHLNIEDDYEWNHPELISDLLYQYKLKALMEINELKGQNKT